MADDRTTENRDMYSRADVEAALRKADAAGDANAARRFAAMLGNWPEGGTRGEQVKAYYDQMPWYMKAATAGADMARIGSNAVTFQQMDRINSLLTGRSYADEQQKTQDARLRAGSASGMAEVGAPAAAYSKIPSAGAALADKVEGPLAKALMYLAGSGAEGAAYSGVDAALNNRDVLPAMGSGAFAGTTGAAAAGLLTKAGNKIFDMFDPPPARMTADELGAAKNQAYKAVENANVEYTPPFVRQVLADMGAQSARAYPGRHDETIAATKALNSRLNNGRAVSLPVMDKNRQIVRMDVADLPDQSQSAMGVGMIRSMDDALKSAGPKDVTTRSGDPAEGIDLLNQARDLALRTRKAEDLDIMSDKARRQAAVNMQSGEESTLRQKANQILNNEDQRRGYTPDEIQALDDIVTGKGVEWLRQLGRMAPGGGLSLTGMGSGAGLGSIVAALSGGNPAVGAAAAAIPPAVGWLAKQGAARGTKKSVDALMDLVAAGGNKAALQRQPTISPDQRDQLARILMLQQLKDQ